MRMKTTDPRSDARRDLPLFYKTAFAALAFAALLAYAPASQAQTNLSSGLISHWKLDEETGLRQDSVNAAGNHLADNNTVAQANGKLGKAAHFTRANAEWLSKADNGSFPKGNVSFTLAAWINMGSRDNQMGIMGKLHAVEYGIIYDPGVGSGQLLFRIRSAADNVVYTVAGATPASNTWYLVMAWHDAAANTINIQVNDGAVNTLSVPEGGVRADLVDPFELGRHSMNNAFCFNGLMDSASLWGRALTDAERVALWNGGNGTDPTGSAPPPPSGNNGWQTSASNVYFSSGNVGINTNSPAERLHVVGSGRVTENFTVDGVISSKYQDVAEWVPSSQKLQAGTVVILDPSRTNQVLASTVAYDTKVAGVVSPRPGLALGEGGEGKVLVATTGRVRVKVDARGGPIKVGDILVTGSLEGTAMKSVPLRVGGVDIHRPGTIVGKALEPLAGGVGEILVLLSLQ